MTKYMNKMNVSHCDTRFNHSNVIQLTNLRIVENGVIVDSGEEHFHNVGFMIKGWDSKRL